MSKKFSIIDFLAKRPLSWSAISSFDYSPEQWYDRYILGKQSTSAEMEFGKAIGKRLETEPSFLPMIPRESMMEHPFKVVMGGIMMVGYADSFCDKTFRKLREFKTGKKKWDQERADSHGQIDMYLLMNFITNRVPPEDVECTIHWMPTRDNGDFSISFVEPIEESIRHFRTGRSTLQVINFGARIKKTIAEMERYVQSRE